MKSSLFTVAILACVGSIVVAEPLLLTKLLLNKALTTLNGQPGHYGGQGSYGQPNFYPGNDPLYSNYGNGYSPGYNSGYNPGYNPGFVNKNSSPNVIIHNTNTNSNTNANLQASQSQQNPAPYNGQY